MEVVEAESWVWFRHETEKWLPCQVMTGGDGDIEIKDEAGTAYNTRPQQCLAMHKSSLSAMPNMVDLGDLNEASILHNLRLRYNNGDDYPGGVHIDTQIFTYIGPIMISVNDLGLDLSGPLLDSLTGKL